MTSRRSCAAGEIRRCGSSCALVFRPSNLTMPYHSVNVEMTNGEGGHFVDLPSFGLLEVHLFGKVSSPLKCSFGPMARRATGPGSVGLVARVIVASIGLGSSVENAQRR